MTTILELKEKLVRFYGKHEAYLVPLMKFALALVMFLMINLNIGYMQRISSTPIAVIMAALCSVFPINVTMVLATVLILLDMYALSLEVCLVMLILFVLIYLIYYRFAPRHGYDVVLTMVCCKLHIPYVMPLGLGLLREAYSVFALACGTILYFFLNGVKQNAKVLSGAVEVEGEAASTFTVALNQLMGNKEMYLVLGVMLTTLLIVYVIRRMSLENAWRVAIISGALFETIGLVAGYMLLGISGKMIGVLAGNLVSVGIAFVIQILFFNLDYSRTEKLQFEDDEYYYYVKAVPKAIISGSDKQVKRFAGRDDREERLTKKQFAREMDIDEDLLD